MSVEKHAHPSRMLYDLIIYRLPLLVLQIAGFVICILHLPVTCTSSMLYQSMVTQHTCDHTVTLLSPQRSLEPSMLTHLGWLITYIYRLP